MVGAAGSSSLGVVLKVGVKSGVLGGEDYVNLLVSGQGGNDGADRVLGGGKIVLVVDVWGVGNNHVQARGDGGTASGGLATAKVVRQADGLVALDAVAGFNASSPLVGTRDAIRTNLVVPEDDSEVRGRLCEYAGALVKVLLGVEGIGSVYAS